MDSFNLGERHAFRMRNVTNLFKSWLVFKTFALADDVMRVRIASGFKPWHFNHPNFKFDEDRGSYVTGDIDSLSEAKDEWKCYMDRWFSCCFENPFASIIMTSFMETWVLVFSANKIVLSVKWLISWMVSLNLLL